MMQVAGMDSGHGLYRRTASASSGFNLLSPNKATIEKSRGIYTITILTVYLSCNFNMGSVDTSFRILDDTMPDDTSLPAFMVSKSRGFLPRMDPIVSLPAEFDVLESLLQRMPVKTASGAPGLLAEGKLGDAVTKELPDLTNVVDKYKANLPLVNALYRDYSFLASAYLLEPCHQRFIKDEPYGLGRDVLPANIARPIARCAEM